MEITSGMVRATSLDMSEVVEQTSRKTCKIANFHFHYHFDVVIENGHKFYEAISTH